jgi:adenosylcobyric acid synthase
LANHKSLHPIMLAGTGSDVGKSVLATALCRIFLQDGYHPAPFKAQNMALNSYATPEGLEIGRAQAVQAEAAGIPCHTDMNPLLLKPQSDHTSQVVLHGKPIGNRDAYDFWRRVEDVRLKEDWDGHSLSPIDFRAEVCSAYDRLATHYHPIVMEGAGSISEINLRDHDLVNLPMARHADARVILVADIDRGGVFASVYGSIALQTPEDRRLIRGIVINKFRGDLRLFDEGRRMLEDLCHVPVLGVVPFLHDVHIEGEDSVALERRFTDSSCMTSQVNVVVVMLRHLSNYTDFDALEQDSRVHLYYSNNVDEIRKADIIILPGTKSTLSDLYELRRNGCAQAILQAHRQGAAVIGICGGYQMMGQEVLDPDHVEGDIERLPGLGLLPVTTTMSGEKITRQAQFSLIMGDEDDRTNKAQEAYKAYEIHMGTTQPVDGATDSPFALLDDGRQDGYVVSEHCMGTYLHGALDNPSVVDRLLKPFADRLQQREQAFDYQSFKQQQYDLLAAHVRQHLNMNLLYQIMSDDD